MTAYIVDLKQEWLNDALHFYDEAMKLKKEKGDLLETLRYLRASIIFSFASIETTVNQYLLDYIEKNRNDICSCCIDKWTEQEGYVRIEEKLTKGVKHWRRGKPLLTQTKYWVHFKQLKRTRDDLVHPKHYDKGRYDVEKLAKTAKNGLNAASGIMKEIKLSYLANLQSKQQ